MNVVVVDDHPVVCEGVAAVLAATPGCEVLATYNSGEALLADIDGLDAHVAVVDFRLGQTNGIELCAALRAVAPHVRVIVMTATPSADLKQAALDAGASAFIAKRSDPTELCDTVQSVANGTPYTPPVTDFGLTPQELSILKLLPRGYTKQQIADELRIGEATVRTHVHNLMRKLHARNRAHAVSIAIQHGII